jgi:hypothetical protein
LRLARMAPLERYEQMKTEHLQILPAKQHLVVLRWCLYGAAGVPFVVPE